MLQPMLCSSSQPQFQLFSLQWPQAELGGPVGNILQGTNGVGMDPERRSCTNHCTVIFPEWVKQNRRSLWEPLRLLWTNQGIWVKSKKAILLQSLTYIIWKIHCQLKYTLQTCRSWRKYRFVWRRKNMSVVRPDIYAPPAKWHIICYRLTLS